ncbi:DUF930 domain-containing protein [Ancylobacter sp. G4_0304]|uniref:DUF930 domain-containing protein n=1 Tax=Ancylobacter sp. G4_0304 TaxID=3114289 RepID=UPI0039C631F0
MTTTPTLPFAFALSLLPLLAGAALARSTADQMLMLDPTARIEQRCNARGMGLLQREHKGLHPDELVAYAYANTVVDHGGIKAPGAAVRSGGDWYHLSYSCQTSHDGMDVTAFDYTLGSIIPKGEWDAHYLVAP